MANLQTVLKKDEKKALIRDFIISKIEHYSEKPTVDRFGNVVYQYADRKYRYKLLERVVRFEKNVTMSEATATSPAIKEWVLIRSLEMKRLYEQAVKANS